MEGLDDVESVLSEICQAFPPLTRECEAALGAFFMPLKEMISAFSAKDLCEQVWRSGKHELARLCFTVNCFSGGSFDLTVFLFVLHLLDIRSASVTLSSPVKQLHHPLLVLRALVRSG